MREVAVVGCGIAGDEAARAARRTDPDVRVVMVTEEPHPLYSPCVLGDYVAGEIPRQRVFLRTPEAYAHEGIELLLSQPVVDWSPDRRMLYAKDREISYDSLILATGSRPLVPPLVGAEKEGVFALKTLSDADSIKEARGTDAVVVGSGPVGIETALALRRLGWNVWIVELLDRVLPRLFDVPMAGLLKTYLENHGIRICLAERVLEVIGGERVEGVLTDRRALQSELVVFVIGMKPEVTLARRGGLVLGPSGGIQVNEGMGTSRPDVWACGDCVESRDRLTGRKGLFMLWNNARLQGQVAGANAARGIIRYNGSLNITTVNLWDRAAASVGLLAADLPNGRARTLHRRGPWGAFSLILEEGNLVGVQALGRTERVGGLLGLLLKGGDLRQRLMERPTLTAGWETWALREVRRELKDLLGHGKAI